MNRHLTDEQLDMLLTGSTNSAKMDAEQHLAACAACRTEYATLTEVLGTFRSAATEASARYTPSRLLLSRAPGSHRPGRMRMMWAAGLVTAAALCTVSVTALHKPTAPATSASTQAPLELSETQSDDALLQSIDQDLATSIPPSLAPLESSTATAEGSTSTLKPN
jgi:predicted anti-sigma-YlaC factor YlaD